jgi:hypothetical protein
MEVTRPNDLARSHMQKEFRFRTLTRCRIRFGAVVVREKLGQPRHEPDQVETATIVSLPNPLLRNRVSDFLNPRLHSRDVEFNSIEADVQDTNARDGVPAQGL